MNNGQNAVATVNQQVAKLGDGEVFVRRDGSGRTLMAVKAELTLREADKELAVIENNPMITAQGYYRANQIAGLSIHTPEYLSIPDIETGEARRVPNPFPIIDKESGTQKGVWVKKVAVGYTPIGSLAVSSTTLFYDFRMYFLADLQKKVQFNKGAGRVCFESQLTDDERAKGLFLRIEGDLGVWANMEHPEVIKAVSTWLQNKNFGERKAQTVAERNAMKQHPALALKLTGFTGPKYQGYGRVAVIGWQHDHSRREIEEIAMAADAGEEVVVDGQAVDVVESTGDVTPEDLTVSDDLDPESVIDVDPVEGASGNGANRERLF